MSKKLLIGVAIGALMASTALAQSPSSPSSSSSSATAASQDLPRADSSAGKADFVSSQKPDQWLATKFKGTDVLGADNQKIGDVSDILFDESGTIQAYVISVGGFLGVGAKEVALAPKSFDLVPGQNGAAPKLKIAMTKEQLKQAQNFARYEPARPTTTGSGPAGLGNSRPMSGGAPSGSK